MKTHTYMHAHTDTRVNKIKELFFKIIEKIDKTLRRLRGKTQINKIREKRRLW